MVGKGGGFTFYRGAMVRLLVYALTDLDRGHKVWRKGRSGGRFHYTVR
jgi:hypothetical protein